MNRATKIVLELVRDIMNDYGENEEVYIYDAEEIEEECLEWCEVCSDLYDEEWFPILMVSKARQEVDFEEIARIITEEKKQETLEYLEWKAKELEKENKDLVEVNCL